MTTPLYTTNGSIVTVTSIPDTFIDDIIDVNPTATTFIFTSGDFFLSKVLHIEKPNLTFIGSTNNPVDVHIFQSNSSMDGISIIFAHSTILDSLSIHVTHKDKIALTIASCNNTLVNNCYIYGNDNTFSVFYPGPKSLEQGQSTIDGYVNNVLDTRNVFRNNTIYTSWSGDSVAFCLQKEGLVDNNIIRGGKMAVYMCKDVDVTNNTVYDSVSNGIYLSLPSKNIYMSGNYIYDCKASGIKVANQMEHGTFTPEHRYNVTIEDNDIVDADFYSIELNNLNNSTVIRNTFISTAVYGIYAYQCEQICMLYNKISYFDVAIWLEGTSNSLVVVNELFSVYPDIAKNVVKLVNASNNNIVTFNNVKGMISYDLYTVDSSSLNNNVINNLYSKYYTREEEKSIMKI